MRSRHYINRDALEAAIMKLWEYEGKRIRLIDIDGQVFTGFIDHYTSDLDNPSGIASLSLEQDGERGNLINLEEPEIASIEILEAAPKMAVAV